MPDLSSVFQGDAAAKPVALFLSNVKGENNK